MQIINTIKKLERAGFTVAVTSYASRELLSRALFAPASLAMAWTATKEGSLDIVEFHRNGTGDDVATLRVRRGTDKDDVQSDYCAGMFYESVQQAINAVDRHIQERGRATIGIKIAHA